MRELSSDRYTLYSVVLGGMDLQGGWDKTGTGGSGAGTMEKVTTFLVRESEQHCGLF